MPLIEVLTTERVDLRDSADDDIGRVQVTTYDGHSKVQVCLYVGSMTLTLHVSVDTATDLAKALTAAADALLDRVAS